LVVDVDLVVEPVAAHLRKEQHPLHAQQSQLSNRQRWPSALHCVQPLVVLAAAEQVEQEEPVALVQLEDLVVGLQIRLRMSRPTSPVLTATVSTLERSQISLV
jgi:hypothetical protein